MKTIAAYSKGRLSTFLFSMLSAAAFFGGGLITLYVLSTGQDKIIGDLLQGTLKGRSNFTSLIGGLLIVGIFCFLLALLSDLLRQVLGHRSGQRSIESRMITFFLTLIHLSSEEQEYITGDLMEEFVQFESKAQAYRWLLNQVRGSLIPLALKTILSRLAFLFGKQSL